jgi:hypothetical protein
VERYEILRTTFVTVDGEPMQKVSPFDRDRDYVTHVDLRPHANPDEALDAIRRSHKQHKFNFETGPLFLATLVQCSDNDFAFLFTLNHIISDAFAVGFMETEFMAVYRDYVQGRPHSLPPIGLQPKDFATWETAVLQGEKGQKFKRYWKTELTGLTNFFAFRHLYRQPAATDLNVVSYREDFRKTLAANFSGVSDQAYEGVVGLYHRAQSRTGNLIRIVIDEPVCLRLKALCGRVNASMSTLSVVALNLLQHHLARHRETVIGLHLTNRLMHPALARISGCMSNTVLVRTSVDPAVTVAEYIRTTQQKISGAYDYMMYPLERVLSDLDVSLDAVGGIYLNYIDTNIIQQAELHDFSRWYQENWGICFFEFDFNIVEFRNGLELTCRYRKDLYDFATAECVVNLFESLLEAMVTAAGQTLETVLTGLAVPAAPGLFADAATA